MEELKIFRKFLNENLETLVAQGEKMAAFADKQSGYEGGIDSPVRNVLTAMKVAGGPGFDGDDKMIDYYTRKLSKAIENQKGKKYMQGLNEGHSLSDDDINYLEAFINMPANEDNVILRRIIKNIIKTNIKS